MTGSEAFDGMSLQSKGSNDSTAEEDAEYLFRTCSYSDDQNGEQFGPMNTGDSRSTVVVPNKQSI
jgi:hypothetical protein